MAPGVDNSVASMHKFGMDLVDRISATVPVQVADGTSRFGQHLVTQLTSLVSVWQTVLLPRISSYTANLTAHVRTHMWPAAQPHVDRFSKEARAILAPAATWTEQQFGGHYRDFRSQFQTQTAQYSHLEIALVSGLVVIVFLYLWSCLLRWLAPESEQPTPQKTSMLRNLPLVRGVVERERAKAIATLKGEIASRDVEKISPLMEMPHAGLDADSVMAELEERASNDFRYADGESKATGTIYMAGETHRELLNDAYCMFSQANPLHVDLFPSIRRMEAEVVAMTASLLGGGHQGVRDVCGTMTGGGSESNIQAVLTSLEYMRKMKGITKPEIIVADTAHASFWKVAKIAQAKLVVIPVNKKTFKLTAANVLSRVSSRTAVIVASAVTYPHGVLDDVQGIARVASRLRVCLHVDSCLGGFVLPFMRHLRYEIPPFDFSLPGVTSMTADTHKYGLAHKGTSVVLYRHKALRRMQFTPVTEWSGGLYVSPGMAGSRSGGLVATAWAAIRHVGSQGYVDITKAMIEATVDFANCVSSVPELSICGDPVMTCLAFKSIKRGFDIYQLQQQLSRRGWNFSSLHKPPALHFVVTQQHINGMDTMKADFLAACEELRSQPSKSASGLAKVYGSAASISDRGLVADMLLDYQDVVLDAE